MSEWTKDAIDRLRMMRDASAAAAFGATNFVVDIPVTAGLIGNWAGNKMGMINDRTYAQNYESLRNYELNPSSSLNNNPISNSIDGYRQQVTQQYPNTFTAAQYLGPGFLAKLATKSIRHGGRKAFEAPLQLGKYRSSNGPAAIATAGAAAGEGFEALVNMTVEK
jgi:hypothetical protein